MTLPREARADGGRPPALGSTSRTPLIAFLIDSLGWGGAERLMLEYLPRLAERGVSVRVAALGERDGNPIAAQLTEAGIAVDRIPVSALRQPSAIPRLAAYLRRIRPDLVHTQLEASDCLGTIAAWLTRVPAVSTQHTMDPRGGVSRVGLRSSTAALILRLLSRRVIVVSEAARRHYVANTLLPGRKLLRIYNGVDVDRFARSDAARARTRAEFGIQPDEILIASVAVLRPDKGIADAMAALADRADGARVRYLIVGDGTDRARLEAERRARGLERTVIFAGARTDVPALLSGADLFMHPSRLDALPTVLAEAMAASLPIISTEVGGIPEMVVAGETGLLVPPGDVVALREACDALLAVPERRVAMGQAARQRAERVFSVDAQVDRLLAIYRETNQAIAG